MIRKRANISAVIVDVTGGGWFHSRGVNTKITISRT